MSTWALVVVKARASGKARLANALGSADRTRLVCSMLDHVLATARNCTHLDRIAMLSPERGGVPHDVLHLVDSGAGLNGKVRHALESLHSHGAQRVAILFADLPRLCHDEIEALLKAAEANTVALAPDRHQRGTNAVCLTLPSLFTTQFGANSFARHLAVAAQLGITPAIVNRPGLAVDVDEAGDLPHVPPRMLSEMVIKVHECQAQHA